MSCDVIISTAAPSSFGGGRPPHAYYLHVAEMRMLRWMRGNIKLVGTHQEKRRRQNDGHGYC